MSVKNIVIAFLLPLFLSNIGFAQIKTVPCGSEWINIHKNNPDLIGVHLQQYPDNNEDKKAYEGKHPAMVIFIFKNNRAHQVSYTPSGQVESGFWWDIPAGHKLLDQMSSDLKPDTDCAFWVKE